MPRVTSLGEMKRFGCVSLFGWLSSSCMRFKVENEGDGSSQIVSSDTLTADSSAQELINALQVSAALSNTQAPLGSEIYYSFPRRRLDTASTQSLADLGIRSGEKFTVKAAANNSAANNAASAANATAQSPIAAEPDRPAQKMDKSSTIPFDGSFLRVKQIPDDNSCLFRAVAYVTDRLAVSEMRGIVSLAIRNGFYDEITLGTTLESYISRISAVNAWGGALELQIFATHFSTEIWAYDVKSLRVDRYGEGAGYSQRVFILYSGIHYDAIAASPTQGPDHVDEFDQTAFACPTAAASGADPLAEAVTRLVSIRNALHEYTDTASFTLSCAVCGASLVGQVDAQEHAKQTGHTSFTEYNASDRKT